MTCEDQNHGKLTNFIRSHQHFDEVFCYFCYISTFSYCFFTLLSPHPTSAATRGIIQSLAGVGKERVALVLQVKEVAIGRIDTAGREAAGRVSGDKEATGSGGKNLTTDEKQVTEGAVRSVRAAGRPGTALVGGHLDGVVAWVDAEEFSLGGDTADGMDDLWHSMMRFRVLRFICCAFSPDARLRHRRQGHDRKE